MKKKNPTNSLYENFLFRIATEGVAKSDRTGTGTRSVFGHQMRFNLAEGFPLVTTKKVHLKSIIAELLWFLTGSTSNNDLRALGCTIWDEWAREDGSLGPVYGKQWRSWPTPDGGHIDQIQQVIDTLKSNPDSRRIIVSAWNVAELDQMALMPCHAFFQFYSAEIPLHERQAIWEAKNPGRMVIGNSSSLLDAVMDDQGIPRRRLCCQLYQRSADGFLGVPFNIASYALLTMMMADQTDHAYGDLIWTGGDCHLYSNHADQVQEQLTRAPRPMPTMTLARKPESIFDYKPEDFVLTGYNPHPAIKAPVAV